MKSTGIINRVQNYKYFLIYANLFAFFRLIQGIGLVVTPFIDEGRHVVRPCGIEEHSFAGTGMGKAEGLGMQYLPRTEGETVLDILAVLLRTKPFEDLTASVFLIGKKRMTDMLHVYTYLVGSSGLQTALNKGDVRELLQYPPMRDGLFGLRTLFEIPYAVDRTIPVIAGKRSFDRTALLFERTPDKGIVRTLCRVVEELFGEVGFGFRGLGNEQETGGVFVDTVNEADGRIVDIYRLRLFEVV